MAQYRKKQTTDISVNYAKDDEYMTPASAWENIKHLIPKDKIIWECFYGDGTSGRNLEALGFEVIHKPIDFFEENEGEILVSNPPFSIKRKVFTRLKELNKPFIMICPCAMLTTQYMRGLFADDNDFQIVVPRKRIQFMKHDGASSGAGCSFDCFYYCWKIGLENQITWLE